MASKHCEETLSRPHGVPLADARTAAAVGHNTARSRRPLVQNPTRAEAMTRTNPRASRAPISLISIVAGTLLAAPARAQSMLDQIIQQKCSAAMQADFAKAGKTPPAGLVQQTCTCVVQQMQATHNLDMAKSLCSQQAGAAAS
jgi:hypothetical protein